MRAIFQRFDESILHHKSTAQSRDCIFIGEVKGKPDEFELVFAFGAKIPLNRFRLFNSNSGYFFPANLVMVLVTLSLSLMTASNFSSLPGYPILRSISADKFSTYPLTLQMRVSLFSRLCSIQLIHLRLLES